MKKTILLLTMVLSMSVTVLCLADEVDIPVSAGFPVREVISPDETAAGNETANAATGSWVQKGQDGQQLNLPGPTYIYYIYPNGSVTNSDGSFRLHAELSDDGSFIIDTSGIEELADYTVSGQVMPISRESMDWFKVKTYDDKYIDYSDIANQLVLTISYPDPGNPLAVSPAVTNVYFLRSNSQATFFKNYISDKVWKIGDNILNIGSDGSLNLNDSESTGNYSIYENKETSSYINAKAVFRWDNGGIVNYVPVQVSGDRIQLQNIDKPEEILTLEYIKDMEKPEPVEESPQEPDEPDESAKPFVGEWEITQVLKDNSEINAAELLETDSMTAQIKENGYLSLKFSNGFSVSLKPVYEGNTLRVKYDNAGYNMNWTAVLENSGTVTAAFSDYRITFKKVH